MPISLELSEAVRTIQGQANQVATHVLRPISRKYDLAEHSYPEELDALADLIDSMGDSEGGAADGRGAGAEEGGDGANLAAVVGITEMCWGDVGLLLSLPRRGLGNSAIAAVASEEQRERFAGSWAAMAITEPEAGSDSAAIRTTAVLDGDEYVLNGEKIYVTAGERANLIVVWASVAPELGRAAIKSFVVERDNPGLRLDRLEHKLGIKASDTANFTLTDCRVPKENLLGNPEIDTSKSFAGVMKTFDNTRPMVAGMAVGLARACLEEASRLLGEQGIEIDYDRPANVQPAAAAELLELEADYEAARLLMLEAAWMADERRPNSVEASMAKAKAGRAATEIALGCVALCGAAGYGESELLEKWARDAKILDIFEGTQQIQLLIIARQLLGKSSAELL